MKEKVITENQGKARLTFMGTGTSQGIPIIGCRCDVCRSKDEKDKRFRSSALVDYEGLRILVDAGPDFRMQMLRARVSHLDAILLTHNHKDHTGGLDDVRALNYIDRRAAEIYCERPVLKDLEAEYPYVFASEKYPGAPEWNMHIIENKPFVIRPCDSKSKIVWVHGQGYCTVAEDGSLTPTKDRAATVAETVEDPHFLGNKDDGDGVEVIPIRGLHDTLPVLGFRFGNIAYITDMSSIPEAEFAKLTGLDHLTLNTVSYKKHHSHFSLYEAIDIAHRIGAKHTWLTHLSHTFPVHEKFCEELRTLSPDLFIQPAYDGLVIE
ncbi:MAG: MBL fold metallo-hydrolase [Bacteroidales bacterium]